MKILEGFGRTPAAITGSAAEGLSGKAADLLGKRNPPEIGLERHRPGMEEGTRRRRVAVGEPIRMTRGTP